MGRPGGAACRVVTRYCAPGSTVFLARQNWRGRGEALEGGGSGKPHQRLLYSNPLDALSDRDQHLTLDARMRTLDWNGRNPRLWSNCSRVTLLCIEAAFHMNVCTERKWPASSKLASTLRACLMFWRCVAARMYSPSALNFNKAPPNILV